MPLPITREINRYIDDQNRPSCLRPSLIHLITLWGTTVSLSAIACGALAIFFIGYSIPNLFSNSHDIDWRSLRALIPMMLAGVALLTGFMVAVDLAMVEYLSPRSHYRLHFLKVIRGYALTQLLPVLPFFIGTFLFLFLGTYWHDASTTFYISLTVTTGLGIVISCLIVALLNCLLFRNTPPARRLIELLPWTLINLSLFLYLWLPPGL